MTKIWSLRPKKYHWDPKKLVYRRHFRKKWFLLLLITSSVYPKKHIVSGQCKFLAIFHFTNSTDVLSESHFEFQAKMAWNYRSQKTKKMAKVRYQIIPLIFSFIFGGVFCDTLEQLRCPKYHRNATKKKERYPFNTVELILKIPPLDPLMCVWGRGRG